MSFQGTSPNTVITNLFRTLASTAAPQQHSNQPNSPGAQTFNTLRDISLETTQQLLALHAFFPNEFLPALDLLDRQLVTRFILDDDISSDDHQHPKSMLYFVLSASMHPSPSSNSTSPGRRRSGSRSHSYGRGQGRFYNPAASGTQYYEVRTQAWNCSCPAFAFSAFPAFMTLDSAAPSLDVSYEGDEWRWGGVSRPRNDDVAPVCKHLLACVLGERISSLFGQHIKEKVVGRDELVAWTAGLAGDGSNV